MEKLKQKNLEKKMHKIIIGRSIQSEHLDQIRFYKPKYRYNNTDDDQKVGSIFSWLKNNRKWKHIYEMSV